MIPFIIKKKLENVPDFKAVNTPYEFYILCSGFKDYDLETFKKGDKIAKFNQEDENEPEPTIPIAINTVSLKLSVCWCINKIIKRKDDIIYQLHNNIWLNDSGEVVPKQINNPNYNIEPEMIDNPDFNISEPESSTNPLQINNPNYNLEPEKIDNPDATFTECDFWLNKMINVNVNDKHLIEEGIAQLDAIQHYWQNIEL